MIFSCYSEYGTRIVVIFTGLPTLGVFDRGTRRQIVYRLRANFESINFVSIVYITQYLILRDCKNYSWTNIAVQSSESTFYRQKYEK